MTGYRYGGSNDAYKYGVRSEYNTGLTNLNMATMHDDGTGSPIQDYSCSSGNVAVIFRDFLPAFERLCSEAEFVLVAAAWMTHKDFIAALTTPKHGSAVVVQKEDFLRPDVGSTSGWAEVLRNRYNTIFCGLDRYDMPGVAGCLDQCGDPSIEAVRCVGNHNSNKSPAAPRMHNKFAVFCKYVPSVDGDELGYGYEQGRLEPYAVWTGSFNLTLNATNSLENVVVLRDPVIASAYAAEWGQLYALSEPLNWDCKWVSPDQRIGT